MTMHQPYQLMEAYNSVYSNEDVISEEETLDIEDWLTQLVQEGYDLDEYSDEELLESYYGSLDEAKVEENEEDWKKGQIRNLRRHKSTGTTTPYTDRLISHTKGRGVKTRGTGIREEVDFYDIISEYLVSEGFCESYEDADVIMANMSEEWRESIIDEAVEIMSVTSPEGKRRKGSRIYSGRASQNLQNARKLSDLRRKQRSNPNAIGSRTARAQSAQEIENNAKKSIKRLNVDPNSEANAGHDDSVDRDGYREVPTDWHARQRRRRGR